MNAEDYLCAANPEADPAEITQFVALLRAREYEVVSPDDTIPQGYVALSEEETVRQTNPMVWARDGRTPVVLLWDGVILYEKER